MSLFNLITWWTTQVSDKNQDSSDSNASSSSSFLMCVSRFNSFESTHDVDKDTIFVGSSTGMLSIYQPSDVFYVTGHQSPTDVIMECRLDGPIIDIICGKFAMTKNDKYSIAVLHPRRVVCYNIAFAEGIAEYGKQFKLQVAFECNLSNAAFSLCNGPFGAVKAKEFLCVNHLTTNELRFLEQDGIFANAVLPVGTSDPDTSEKTLPSAMLYLPRVDCFVIISMPEDVLKCHKYQDLITSTTQSPTAPLWTFCVGEFVLEMATHQTTNTESVILLLGEHNLICLTDGGIIKFIKKLDYTAITFHSFVIGYYFEPDARLMLAIASDMDSLFMYEAGNSIAGPTNCKLIWSTQLPFAPLAIARANFDGITGGLVLLGETGRINVTFFGTDPQMFKVAALNKPEDNVQVESVQRQLNRLEGDIKQGIDFTDVSFINGATNRDLQITIHPQFKLYPCKPNMTKNIINLTVEPQMAVVKFKLTTKIPFEQIQIAINPATPMAVTENTVMFEKVEADEELEWECGIYLRNMQSPATLTVPVTVSMVNRQGVPRILEKSFEVLPTLILKQCSPQKEAQYKVTVQVNSNTKEISDLFPEFATDTINQQALGLKSIYSGAIITIVLGKHSNRYRVQSDDLSAIPIVCELLVKRLEKPLKTNPSNSSIIANSPEGFSINQSYFMKELVEEIERHSQCRMEVKTRDQEIAKMSRQMRLFQRKLFLRLQQDPPHPSYKSAAKLLRLTHDKLTNAQAELMKAVDRWRTSQLLLGNQLRLIKLIIHHSKMPRIVKDNLFASLICPINDWIEMSWEETLAPTFEMMAHIGPLAKNKQGSDTDIEDIKSFSQRPFDMERFQKNLKYLLGKLSSAAEKDFVGLEEKEERPPHEDQGSDWLDGDGSGQDTADVDDEEPSSAIM